MQPGESLLVKPITKCESSTQTDLHPLETNIDKSYEWNEWELRRKDWWAWWIHTVTSDHVVLYVALFALFWHQTTSRINRQKFRLWKNSCQIVVIMLTVCEHTHHWAVYWCLIKTLVCPCSTSLIISARFSFAINTNGSWCLTLFTQERGQNQLYWPCMRTHTSNLTPVYWTLYDGLSVHQSDGQRKEVVLVTGSFGLQCSVVPTWGEELELVESRVWWVCSDVSCPFPDSGDVQVLVGGQAGTNDFFSADLTVLCSLFLSCLVADPNQTAMHAQRTDWMIAL